jgi:transcriptional regulator with XRE-family HTH domain
MQDEQIPQSVPEGSLRRTAARDARRRWANEVQQALRERGLSINAAAKAIGISPGRLQAWLSQDVEPSPRAMKDLAQVIGRQHTWLLQLLGWLPAELSAVPLRLEAAVKLQEAMAEARRWVEGSSSEAGLGGGSQIAGALLEAGDGWEAVLRQAVRGVRHPVRHATLVAFARVDDPAAAAPTRETTVKDRAEIMGLIQDTVQRTSAHWLARDHPEGRGWPKRPDLVLSVPVLGAIRPRGLLPNLTVPQSIVVVGGPFTGSQDVAALLAGTLDWAYFDLAAAARLEFGLPFDAPAERADNAQAEMARRLLEGPERLTVWSYSALRPIRQTSPQLGAELPLAVLLMAPEGLLEQASRQLETEEGQEPDDPETVQNVARRWLARRKDEATYLILEVPEPSVDPRDPASADQLFDTSVELAFRAAQWLHERHGGPSLDDAGGVLGRLWRGRGAPAEDRSSPSRLPKGVP